MENNINNFNAFLETVSQMMDNKDFVDLLKQKKKEQNEQNLAFTEKEIEKMPKTFRKEFRTDGCTARVYKSKFSKNTYGYVIKYRRNGYNVYAADVNLEKAKEKFIEKLKTAEKIVQATKGTPKTFNMFAMFYFEKFRKRTVTPKTYEGDINRYKKYLLPYFEEKPLLKITSLECQELIDEIANSGKGKTADEIFSLLSVIFKNAIAHSVLQKNPMDIVIHKKHQREHGKALTKEEEIKLLQETAGTEYQLMYAIALYTGMRPNEFETAKRDGDFIIANNSKRKGGKVESKRIPITPMLKPYIKDIQEFTFYKPYTLREKFNSILPNHILYDLRTTFYSRCTECGISDVVQKLFVGHSLGELGNAYTDLSDDFLLKEGNKLKY